MSEREIITGYRENVIAWHTIQQCMSWNQRHGLPVLTMPEQLRALKDSIMQFEDVLEGIPDRRTRNILRCRYALGWNNADTAIYMDLSRNAVQMICKTALDRMS